MAHKQIMFLPAARGKLADAFHVAPEPKSKSALIQSIWSAPMRSQAAVEAE